MSLASFLLNGKVSSIDNELDSLLKSQPAPPPRPITTPTTSKSEPSRKDPPVDTSKRKRKESPVKKLPLSTAKRQKPDVTKPSKSTVKSRTKVPSEPHKRQKTSVKSGTDTDSDDEENDPVLEDEYLRRTVASATKKDPAPQSNSTAPKEAVDANSGGSSGDDEDDDEDEDRDYDVNVPPPKHETHTGSEMQTRRKKAKKVKYVPPGETPAQRDARTVFIGNVSIDVVKSRPAQKQLKRHILQLVSQAKIESMRFRSVAFSAPTNSLKDEKKPDTSTVSTKEKRQMERAETWRRSGKETEKGLEGKTKNDDASDDDQEQKSPHPTLTPAQRKRVAFYKHEFHNEVDTANAYVVFAHTHEDTAKDSSILHPAEAARRLVEKGNGTVFMTRTLRMDRVGQWRAGLPDSEQNHINLETSVDPHCTLFVGNLDFAAKEEDLRTFFDALLFKERNDPPGNQLITEKNDEVSALKKESWVKSVRIIRDRDTQLGKGFAYIRFIDRECVDEILALEPGSVKFAKRKLRLQRCKGVPGATPKSTPIVKPTKGKSPQMKTKARTTLAKSKSSKLQNPPVAIPKGDPNLGTKLASLSKEERKAAKAADSARLERRLAKKRAKQKQGNTGAEKLEDRQRHRQRKSVTVGKKTRSAGSKIGRLRSEKSLSKRNLKK